MRSAGCGTLTLLRLLHGSFAGICFFMSGCASVPLEEQAEFNAKMDRLGSAIGDLRGPQPVCVISQDSTLTGERTSLGGTYYAPSSRGPIQRRCYAQPR